MLVTDFATQFKTFSDHLGQAAKGLYSVVDQWSFKMLVDCLKSNDYDVAAESIDQLVKEKRLLGIPPLYFVGHAHPNPYVREKANKALPELGQSNEINQLTAGKSLEDATKSLIQKYGNYNC